MQCNNKVNVLGLTSTGTRFASNKHCPVFPLVHRTYIHLIERPTAADHCCEEGYFLLHSPQHVYRGSLNGTTTQSSFAASVEDCRNKCRMKSRPNTGGTNFQTQACYPSHRPHSPSNSRCWISRRSRGLKVLGGRFEFLEENQEFQRWGRV